MWHPFTQAFEASPPIPIVKGKGAYLYTEGGEAYLDGISSWWVNLHGHSHPYIAEKIGAQARELEHVIFAGYTHPQAVRLAERLLSLFSDRGSCKTALPGKIDDFVAGNKWQQSCHAPFDAVGPKWAGQGEWVEMAPKGRFCWANEFCNCLDTYSHVFYSDNGSTAVEVALKMAFQVKGNGKQVLSFQGAYHGDTFGAMAAAGRSHYNQPFWPYLFQVHSVQPPMLGKEEASLREFERAIATEKIAAFIFEPLVQGAGGMRLHSGELLGRMIQTCQQRGIITIADEVMTGFGRTGPLFACNTLDAYPDLICLSKGITGGFLPLGATLAKKTIFDSFLSPDPARAFLHGHSYTANPLACAAANASLDLLLQEGCHEMRKMIESEHLHFQTRWKDHPKLARCEVLGTILALEYQEEDASYHSPLKKRLTDFFKREGVLLRPLGNVLYLMPPYCICREELHKIYSLIAVTLEEWP